MGLSGWKTSHVTSMAGMFEGAQSFGLPVETPVEHTEAYQVVMAQIRRKNEYVWNMFEQQRPTVNSIEQLPWPSGPAGNRFAFSPMHDASPEEVKKILRNLNLRWHPD